MTIYIVLYSILLWSIFFEKKSTLNVQTNIIYFFVIVFTLFRGLRWNTGTDWWQFYDVFQLADWDNIFSFSRYSSETTLEFGYVLINVLIKKLGGNYTFFLLITNFFILCSYARFSLKQSSTPILLFVNILLTVQIFPVRLHIATAILLFSFNYIFERKFIQFLIIVFLASTIHSSAWIFAPVYFLYGHSINIKCVLVFGAIFLIFSNVFNSLLLELIYWTTSKFTFLGPSIINKLLTYTNYTPDSVGPVRNSIMSILFSLIFLIFFGRLTITAKESTKTTMNLYFYIFVIFTIIMRLIPFYGLKRLGEYFFIGAPFLLTILINESLKVFHPRILVYLLFFAYMYYKLYYLMIFYGELHIPYYTVFDSLIYRED